MTPTRTALAVQHVPFEDLGTLEPVLRSRGYAITTLDATVEPVTPEAFLEPDLLVVLGGPVGVYDAPTYPFLAAERDALAARVADPTRPTLGICLGAQLLAAALGAPVTSTGRVEIGYAPLTLTPDGADSPLAPLAGVPVLHWHGDELAIPGGARRLAETPGFPNQAFDLGPALLGLQFHVEADPARIEQWLVGHSHELAAHGIDPRSLRADAAAHGEVLARAAAAVGHAWLDGAEAA